MTRQGRRPGNRAAVLRFGSRVALRRSFGMAKDTSPSRSRHQSGPWLFVALAFLLTWALAGSFALMDPAARRGEPGTTTLAASYVAVWGPSLAGLCLAWRDRGSEAVVAMLGRLWRWPGMVMLLLAILLPLGGELLGAAFGWWLGPYQFMPLARLGPATIAMFLITTLGSGPLGEEFGWRGYGLYSAAERYGPRIAAVLMAAAWSLWHLPAFVVPGLQHLIFPTGLSFLEFACFTLTGGVMSAWLTFRSRGALAPAVIFHLCLLAMLLAVSERPPPTLTWSTVAVFAGLAALILWRDPTLGYLADDAP